MFRKLLAYTVRGYVRGPAKSWIFTSGALMLARFVQSKTAKTEIIDMSKTKPGDRILIEHLDITHAEQIKAQKAAKKAARRANRDARRLGVRS
jgi:hypothetical protein